jgi:hypothetical protein
LKHDKPHLGTSRRNVILLAGLLVSLVCSLLVWTGTRPPAEIHFAGYTKLYGITMARFSVSNRCSAAVYYTITAEQNRNGTWTNFSGVLQTSGWKGPVPPLQDFSFNWPLDWEQGTWRLRAELRVGPTGVRKLLCNAVTHLGPTVVKRLGVLFENRAFVVLSPEIRPQDHPSGTSN